MPQILDSKVVAWRDADIRARAAEQALNKLLFDHDGKPAATADLIKEAKLSRQLADEKLQAAIAVMRPNR